MDTSIFALSIHIPGEAGLAFFDKSGKLESNNTIILDENGHLKIDALYNMLDGRGNVINNVSLFNSQLTGKQVFLASESLVSGSAIIATMQASSLTSNNSTPMLISNVRVDNCISIDALVINTNTLTANSATFQSKTDFLSPASFADSVHIGKSLTVTGSVIGSGAYIDSSDKRFKLNITTINSNSALNLVKSMQAVSYYFDQERFPNKNFPTSKQIGWIADDIELIVPEIVDKDNLGYRSIAYSHANVLIAEAVKELVIKYDEEVRVLKAEMAKLRLFVERRMKQ